MGRWSSLGFSVGTGWVLLLVLFGLWFLWLIPFGLLSLMGGDPIDRSVAIGTWVTMPSLFLVAGLALARHRPLGWLALCMVAAVIVAAFVPFTLH
jgi:hypothetical protein